MVTEWQGRRSWIEEDGADEMGQRTELDEVGRMKQDDVGTEYDRLNGTVDRTKQIIIISQTLT